MGILQDKWKILAKWAGPGKVNLKKQQSDNPADREQPS